MLRARHRQQFAMSPALHRRWLALTPCTSPPSTRHGLRARCARVARLRLDELLAAKAGVDGHDEHQVHVRQHVLDGAQRRRRVEHHARLAPQVLDLRDRARSRAAGPGLGGRPGR